MRVLEGLARHLQYRMSGFTIGSDIESCFTDASIVCFGGLERMVSGYFESLTDNIFTDPRVMQRLGGRGAVSLDDLPVPSRDGYRAYVENLTRRAKISSKMFFHLSGERGITGVICLVDSEPDSFKDRDLFIVQILRKHLGNLLQQHVEPPRAASPSAAAGLSPRQVEVVALLAQGLTNQQIAEELCIGVDTVKKHLTQALRVSGCRNRTQLALWWRSLTTS